MGAAWRRRRVPGARAGPRAREPAAAVAGAGARSPGGCERPASVVFSPAGTTPLLVTETGDDVAQGAELGDDGVATLLVAVHLRLERRELALGLGLSGGGEAGRLGLCRGDDLLRLAAGVGHQPVGLLLGVLALVVRRGDRLAGPRLGSVGPLLGLLHQPLGLRGGGGVVLRRLTGQPLLLDRQRPAGLLHLTVGGRSGLLRLSLGAGAHRVGLLLRGQAELLALPAGGREEVRGLGRGLGPLLLHLGERAAAGLVELL